MPPRKKNSTIANPIELNIDPDASKRPVGRPPKDGAFRINVQARVPEEVADALQQLGGTPFIRQILTIAADNYKEQIALNNQMRNVAVDAILEEVTAYIQPEAEKMTAKMYNYSVPCGLPTPAIDNEGEPFNFYDYLIHHPGDTFVMYAKGDSMNLAGVEDGDLIIINRQLEARSGDIVLAFLNGDFTLKRLKIKRNNDVELHPESTTDIYPVIRPTLTDDFQIIGVLTGSCRRYR